MGKSPFKQPHGSQQWQRWPEFTDIMSCIWNQGGDFLPHWWQTSTCPLGLRAGGTKLLPGLRTNWWCSATYPGDSWGLEIQLGWNWLLPSAYQSAATYNLESVTYGKVPFWDTSPVLFLVHITSTASAERMQRSLWTLKSASGWQLATALRMAQREWKQKMTKLYQCQSLASNIACCIFIHLVQ